MKYREREANARDRVTRLMAHIADQIEKRQYLNALSAANDLEKELITCLDCVLKRQPIPAPEENP